MSCAAWQRRRRWRRMRNEAKIKLIYKWRKKINKKKNTQQKAKHFFIYPSRLPPCSSYHCTDPPLLLLPWHCLVSPLPPLWKIRFICARLLYYLNSCVIFLNFRVLSLLSHSVLLLCSVLLLLLLLLSGGILMENAAKVEEVEMFKQTKPPWNREAV